MKTAKSYKTVIMAIVCVLCFILALCPLTAPITDVSADTIGAAGEYFTGLGSENVKFDGGFVVADVTEDSVVREELSDPTNPTSDKVTVEDGVLSIKNLLVVSDFEMVLKIPANLEGLTVVIKNEAYYANGNVYVDAEGNKTVKKEIVNEFKFDFLTDKVTVNGITAEAEAFTLDSENNLVILTSVQDNYLKAIVGDSNTELLTKDVVSAPSVKECRMIKEIDGKAMASIKFMFDVADTVSESAPAQFKIKSIDQKASDANEYYKQTFETADGKITDDQTYPRVAVSEDFYKKNADGTYSLKKDVAVKHTLTFAVYSVLSNVSSSKVYVKATDGMWVETNTEFPKNIEFEREGTFNIEIAGVNSTVYETISGIEVVDFENDEEAPKYVVDPDALESFGVALYHAYYDVKGQHSTALGTNLNVPSLKDLVFDDYVTYEKLTKNVYYNTESSSELSSNGMTLSLSEAGRYNFRVSFADGNGNGMDKTKDFIKSDENPTPLYSDYIFSFSVQDDAPISVKEATSQGIGYKGIAYNASKFTVEALGCNTVYTLYYNSSLTAGASDEWIEIPTAASVTDENYDKDGYTYKDIKDINFNGNLSFTPNKLGSYKIVCSVTSNVSSRSAEAFTIVRVSQEPSVVKVPSTWLQDNVWSVVFLSIGTLCLIGIIVLLCIKPKDEVDAD